MKNFVKAAVALALLCLMAGGFTLANAYGDISVRMDGVVSEDSIYVPFGDIKPVQLESRTLIPARSMGEAAGMVVTWDQPTQTAILTLKADAYSDKPIERYAAQLFSKLNPPAPSLTAVDMTAALKLGSGTAVIRFNYVDNEGDYVALGTKYSMVSRAIIVDDGTLMIPIRDSMEMFGLNVGWNQDDLCAYVSIPNTVTLPENLTITANHGEGEFAPTEENYAEYESYSYQDLLNGGDGRTSYAGYDYEDTSGLQIGEYIGTFKITHYCPCDICNGYWGAGTAWAGAIIPGQTIAVNPGVISPLEWVYVDGYGYRRAEDTGSGVAEYQIDMAVPVHAMAIAMGVVYKDVYRTR